MELANSVSQARSRLVLLAMGSTDPRWQKPFIHLCLKLKEELGADEVVLGFLEQAEPCLMEIAREAVEDKIGNLVILPMFLALGQYLEQEIPRQVAGIREQYPEIAIILLPPIGEHPAVANTIYDVAKAFYLALPPYRP